MIELKTVQNATEHFLNPEMPLPTWSGCAGLMERSNGCTSELSLWAD